jgi:hypothetical protein
VPKHIASGTLKAQGPKMASQRICIFKSVDAFPEQPSDVVEARVPTECAAPLDEMADQVGENIFIRHPRDRRCEKRNICLCAREDPSRRHAKQAVWKEVLVHIDAERPAITGKRASRAGAHGRFEAQRA